jgi:anaerobic selenocysteine-containing dehydrogenase
MNGQQAHFRTCNLCEAMCGVVIETTTSDKGLQILSIKGDKQDPLSQGAICPKAIALKDLHEDPDRLKKPLMKTEKGWKEIGWKQAFDLVANRIKTIQKQYGRNAVGTYLGNPNVHNHGTMLTILPFIKALRTKKRFSATSNDQLPHMLVSQQMYGHQALFPVPDIDHTDLFICMGGNPIASNGSLMSAPGMSRRLKEIKSRGGRVIVIDPRRTETADIASEHIPIRPGTDALLLLGMMHTLFKENLASLGRLKSFCHQHEIDSLRQISEDFPSTRVSKQTGIPSHTIEALARALADTPRALLYGRMGTSTQVFGTLSTWLINVINLLTGHLDQRGGVMFTKPAADLVEIGALLGQTGHYNRFQSSVKKLPEFSGELPSNAMADEILEAGEDRIRAMIVSAGNPCLSSPNGKRLDKAFASLDFMVSIDFYLNESSRHADIILPPTGPLEHSHFDIIFNMVAVRNVAKYSPALFKPAPDTRHDYQIFFELTRRLDKRDMSSAIKAEMNYQVMNKLGADGILDLFLRAGPYGTQIPGTKALTGLISELGRGLLKSTHPLRKLIDMSPYGAENRSLPKGMSLSTLASYPHGIDLGALQPRLPDRLYTSDQKIKLTPSIFLQDIKRLKKTVANPHPDDLLLIGRRHVRSNNSWLHNSHRLVKGKNRCTLKIHPDNAKKLKLKDNDLAIVSSKVGEITIPIEITDEMMPGVISIPHGWGHTQSDTQLSIAHKVPGVSLNDITDDSLVDIPSGTSILNGIPVKVQAAMKSSAKMTARKKAKAVA